MTRITLTPAGIDIPYNVIDYSIQEDGGNLDASKLDGGVPQLTATITDFPTSQRLMDDLVTLSDDLRGSLTGIVRSVTRSNGLATITADSALTLLNTYRSVPPFPNSGFQTYLINLFSYLGVDSTLSLFVDAGIASDVFAYPGFVGNVFDQLKQLCSARGYVMNVSGLTLTIRPARAYTLDESQRTDSGDSLNSQQSAQQIVVNYQNYSAYGTFAAYPPPGSDPAELSPITVNAGERVVQTFQMNGTASSVNQPVAVNAIVLGATNQYAIIGNDSLPVTAAQWLAQGGSVTARVLPDDSSVVEITVIGARNTALAPFRLAESSGNNYSALYISATGYSKDPKSVTIETGAPPGVTSEKVGITVANPYISSAADAYTRGMIVAANYAGPTYTTNDGAARLKNASFSNASVAFSVGNRLVRNDVNLIVTSVNTNAGGVSYNANLDTIMNDFNTKWSGQTFNTFNTQWSGYTFTEMTPIPLRRN